PAFPAHPALLSSLPSERLDEEQNQRDEQHVDHERLDQDEAQDQVAANLAGRAGVPRDAFDRGSETAGLAQRAERGRNGQREARGDDRPLDQLRAAGGSGSGRDDRGRGSCTRNGKRLNRIRMTRSSPKMLPKSRSDNDSTRDRWLMISMGSMMGARKIGAPGGAAKCFR